MIELLPPEDAERFRRRFAVLPDMAVYRAILRTTWDEQRWRRFSWNPWTNPEVWDAFEARLEQDLAQLDRESGSPADAVARAEDVLRLLREYLGIHVCSLLFANLCDQLVEAALATWMPERSAELSRSLLVSLPQNRTLEVNLALGDLAHHAAEADLRALEEGKEPSTEFSRLLRGFLARYGHRSHASWDVMAPRWCDEPRRLVPLLRASRGARPENESITRESRFTEAMAEVDRALAGTTQGAVLRTLVKMGRRYLLLRENQRFRFEQIQLVFRKILLGIGARLVDEGWLSTAEDVKFLSWDEVRAAALGGLGKEIAGFLPRRRTSWLAAWDQDPPQFLRGEEAIPVPEGAARLEGNGVSAGRATGKVVRARTLADAARLGPGDVLVVSAVDPGWTPLLRTAGAMILEMGGRLSHGAVVAREYGVPAVVNVEGALSRLRDGQEVTVDGTRGIVYVHG
jgi:pyruvate,water dikinase